MFYNYIYVIERFNKTISWKNINGEFNSFNDIPSYKGYGESIWHHNGKLHRGYGRPAVIYPNGNCEYWYYGRRVG